MPRGCPHIDDGMMWKKEMDTGEMREDERESHSVTTKKMTPIAMTRHRYEPSWFLDTPRLQVR